MHLLATGRLVWYRVQRTGVGLAWRLVGAHEFVGPTADRHGLSSGQSSACMVRTGSACVYGAVPAKISGAGEGKSLCEG